MSEYRSRTAPESEPLLSRGTITAAAAAVLALVVAFGLPLSDNQQAAILALCGVAAPIVVAVWGRSRVFSPATVAREYTEAQPPDARD